MQLINATCKFPGGAPRISQSGREYVSALFVGPDGQEHRVYAPPAGATTEALQQLAQGQTVTLALDSRGKAHICLPEGDRPAQPLGFHPTPAAAPQPVPTVQHQQPATYSAPAPAAAVADPAIAAADLLASIYRRLIQQGVPEGVAGPMSSTAFIQLSRG